MQNFPDKMFRMIAKSILIWISIIPLAFINAGLRELVFTPLIGAKHSLPISGLTLSVLILVVSFIFIPKLGNATYRTYWLIGFLWMFLTIIFETVMSLFSEKTLNDIIKAYDIRTGNLWLFVVIVVSCAPSLIARVRHLESKI